MICSMICRAPCVRCDERFGRGPEVYAAEDCRCTDQELRLTDDRVVTVYCLNCGHESDPINDIGTASLYALMALDYREAVA